MRVWKMAPLLVSVWISAPAGAHAASFTIMAEDASEPFSRGDGTGYANDIVKAAFQAAGFDVRLNVVPYARCKKSLEDGTTAACFSMSWIPEFKDRIVFSDQPLYQVYADVFQNSQAPRKISSANDLPKRLRSSASSMNMNIPTPSMPWRGAA